MADKWHWKFNLPPFVSFFFLFSLIIDFCLFPLFFTTYLNCVPHRKKTWCAHTVEVWDADGMAEWPLDLSEWHWPHICLSVDSRCWTDVVLTQTEHHAQSIREYDQLNPSITVQRFLDKCLFNFWQSFWLMIHSSYNTYIHT